MRVNVDKVLERDQKLSELDDRAGQFSVTSIMLMHLCYNWCVVDDIFVCPVQFVAK